MNKLKIVIAMTVAVAGFLFHGVATEVPVDDLQGLRPDTQGVETNAFWDTRAHSTYTVQVSRGVNTNDIMTAFLTRKASRPDNIGIPKSTMLMVK